MEIGNSSSTSNPGLHDDSKIIRHCAYCLKICDFPVKKCAGCKKRAYCSKECQIADWSVKGTGQRHVNWCCRYECGEEDLDWQVVPIPNKGLGIRAKRFLPAGFRIIVEPSFTDPYAHPGIKELQPEGGLLQEKFDSNVLMQADKVALRTARVNHSCAYNAAHVYDDVACVEILYAVRDIQPGEEICVYYISPADLMSLHLSGRGGLDNERQCIKDTLRNKWGIICPADCFCKDPDGRRRTKDCLQLSREMQMMGQMGHTEQALEVGEKLLEIQKSLNCPWIPRAQANFSLFEISIMDRETLPRANGYIQAVVNIFKTIIPYSKSTAKMVAMMNNPKLNHNYLVKEKYN